LGMPFSIWVSWVLLLFGFLIVFFINYRTLKCHLPLLWECDPS
jgi:hypothetical protein